MITFWHDYISVIPVLTWLNFCNIKRQTHDYVNPNVTISLLVVKKLFIGTDIITSHIDTIVEPASTTFWLQHRLNVTVVITTFAVYRIMSGKY